MAIEVLHGKTDTTLEQVGVALERYQSEHPAARISMYRQNSASVRVRIVDPVFVGMSRPDRSDYVWKYLETLPDDVQSDISTVLLLTADEIDRSFGNFEFENPIPSTL